MEINRSIIVNLLNNLNKMYYSPCSTEEPTRKQECNRSKTFHGENRLSPEPTICRTMTVGKQSYTGQNKLNTQTQIFYTSNIASNQKRKLNNSRNPLEMIQPSIHPTMANTLPQENSPRKVSRCSQQVFTANSSLPSSHCRSSGHHWTTGMTLLVFTIIINIISNPSGVLCVPLTSQQQQESINMAGSLLSEDLPNPQIRELEQKRHPQDELSSSAPSSYTILPAGQIYLPSLSKNARVRRTGNAPSSDGIFSRKENNEGYLENPSNYLQKFHYPRNKDEQATLSHAAAASIQKILNQQQKGFLGGMAKEDEKAEGKEFDDDDDSESSRLGYENSADDALGQSEWETVLDPHLYVLTEFGSSALKEQYPVVVHQQRKRRNSGSGPSLSIVNPLDVLRQRLLLEIARRRMRQSHNQIIANEEILRKIGRRRR